MELKMALELLIEVIGTPAGCEVSRIKSERSHLIPILRDLQPWRDRGILSYGLQ